MDLCSAMTDTCELVVKYKCGNAFHCGCAFGVAVFVSAVVGDFSYWKIR